MQTFAGHESDINAVQYVPFVRPYPPSISSISCFLYILYLFNLINTSADISPMAKHSELDRTTPHAVSLTSAPTES